MIDNSKEYILCAAVRRLDGGFDCGFRHNRGREREDWMLKMAILIF